jgi:hypothetical protein
VSRSGGCDCMQSRLICSYVVVRFTITFVCGKLPNSHCQPDIELHSQTHSPQIILQEVCWQVIHEGACHELQSTCLLTYLKVSEQPSPQPLIARYPCTIHHVTRPRYFPSLLQLLTQNPTVNCAYIPPCRDIETSLHF